MANDFDALDEALDEGRNESSSNDDIPERPWLKATPRAAFKGTVQDIGFSGSIKDEQNLRGADGYGGDFVITLDDVEVLLGDLYESSQRDGGLTRANDDAKRNNGKPENVDYRIVGDENSKVDDLVEEVDDEYVPTGVEVHGTGFRSEQVDEFDDDADLWIGSQSGRLIAQGLDAFGAQSAYYQDGEKTNGMVEYHPKWSTDEWESDDGYPRIARTPELHPDLVGEEIIIYLRQGDEFQGNRKTLGHVFLADADEIEECTELTGNALDVFDETDVDVYSPWLVWHDRDDDSSSGDDDDGDFSFDAGAVGDDDGEDQSYDDLTASQQAFADEAIGHVEDADDDTLNAVFDDFDSTIDGVVDAGEIESISPTAMRAAIDGRLNA